MFDTINLSIKCKFTASLSMCHHSSYKVVATTSHTPLEVEYQIKIPCNFIAVLDPFVAFNIELETLGPEITVRIHYLGCG